jgi:TPR repeat protein
MVLAFVALSCKTARQPVPVSNGSREPAPSVEGTTPRPTATADQWRPGCDAGDQTACNNLAFLIEQTEPEKAERLYAQACAHDVPPACHNQGFLVYHRGDLGSAVPLFVKACSLSHAPACETLRSMMNAQARKTGNVSCLEIPKRGGVVDHVCSDPEIGR